MIIIFAIVFLTAYLATGVQVARMRYGLDYRKYEAVKGGQNDNYNKLNNKTLSLQKLNHASWCYLEYDMLKSKGCNCGNKSKWFDLRNDIKDIKAAGYVSPAQVSYSTLGLWPLWFLSQYIQKLKPEHEIVKGEVVEDEFDVPVTGYRREIEADPLYQEITKTWEELEALARSDMNKAPKIGTVSSKGRPKDSIKTSGRSRDDYARYYGKKY